MVRGIVLLVGVMACGSLTAGELALLHTGAEMLIARHERLGDTLRLHLEGGGHVELPSSAVVRIEASQPQAKPAPPADPAPDAEKPETLEDLVELAAERFLLPRELIHSVIAAESAYDPEAISRAGAVGLMQLMPGTAADLAVTDRTDPEQNVRGGAQYLRQLLDEYEGADDQLVLALAAYNAGPAAVRRYGGVPPYEETRAYLRRVLTRFLRLADDHANGQ